MNPEMQAIVDSVIELYGKISRTHENLMKLGASRVTLGAIDARLQNLEKYWSKFDALKDRLLDHLSLLTHHYMKRDIPSLAEEAYLTNKGMLLDLRRVLQAKEANAPA